MPHSHHSHSGQFCKHAVGTLEKIVQEAISKQFVVFGMTEHVPRYREIDLYPEEQGLSLAAINQQFISFLDEAKRLKAHYASQITLLVGLETEFITPRDLEELECILKQYQPHVIEYIVGSVHHVHGIPIDFDEATYRRSVTSFGGGGTWDLKEEEEEEEDRRQLEAFLLAYFDAQYELLQRFKPEIVGHLDLCRLYTPDLKFTDFQEVWKRIERNVEYAISYGALFEVNAAAFRKKWKTAYPGPDVAQLILQRGGRFALSDDSHGPHAVGLNYNRVHHYLRSLNVAELWFLEPSEEPNASGRKVRPVKLKMWWEEQFWFSLLTENKIDMHGL